jgi:hypothetical protein
MNGWKRAEVALLIGCIATAILASVQPHLKAGSIPDIICDLLMTPGMLVASFFHDRGTASTEFVWRSRIAEAAILAAITWLSFRVRRSVSVSTGP